MILPRLGRRAAVPPSLEFAAQIRRALETAGFTVATTPSQNAPACGYRKTQQASW
jgi:hypothetical protein